MLRYILQRLILIPILLIIFSIMVFALVQAPPGDFLTSYIATLASTGSSLNQETIAMLEHQFGLDQPVYIQYLRWMQNLLRGDLGLSLEYQLPNAELIADRLGLTLILALFAFVFTWVMAIPIGIYRADKTHNLWMSG